VIKKTTCRLARSPSWIWEENRKEGMKKHYGEMERKGKGRKGRESEKGVWKLGESLHQRF